MGASSLGPAWLVLVRVYKIDLLLVVFTFRVFHVNIDVIAIWFKFILFYFVSLEIARNILIWY